MAALRNRAQVPIGSTQWVLDERAQMAQFQEQEMEDFGFAVRNEVDWLNEHMAGIFENSQMYCEPPPSVHDGDILTANSDVAEVFKTPGKLRGKTPRTARKHTQEHRTPLGEILPTDIRYNPSPARNIFANDSDKRGSPQRVELGNSPRRLSMSKPVTENDEPATHAGDEMEFDATETAVEEVPQPVSVEEVPRTASVDDMDVDQPEQQTTTSEPPHEEASASPLKHGASDHDTTMETAPRTSEPARTTGVTRQSSIVASPIKEKEDVNPAPGAPKDSAPVENESILGAESESSSQRSSPDRGLVRKSSLTFASLPARDPIPTKKSIGNLASRNSNADASKSAALTRNSYLDRVTGGKSLGGIRPTDVDDMDLDGEQKTGEALEESDGGSKMAKLHNKSSTQRLHERINMLGKTQAPRPTKSIPAVAAQAQPAYPELSKAIADSKPSARESLAQALKPTARAAVNDDEDEWIKPLPVKTQQPVRPELSKSRSVDVMEQIVGKETISQEELRHDSGAVASHQTRPTSSKTLAHEPTAFKSPTPPHKPSDFHKKAVSVSNPSIPPIASTTPAGSPPAKHNLDGHISASKSKLQSIMKSARGLFSSSARASTQAKLDMLSPTSRARHVQANGLNGIAEQAPATATEEASRPPPVPPKEPTAKPAVNEPRRLRNSTEKQREEARKQQQVEQSIPSEEEPQKRAAIAEPSKRTEVQPKAAAQPKAAPEPAPAELAPPAPARPTRQSPRRPQQTATTAAPQRPPSAAESTSSQSTALSRPTAQTTQKGKEPRRPGRPLKNPPAAAQRPQPVSIRVGTLSQRVPLTNATLASGLQDSLAPAQPAGAVQQPRAAPAPAGPGKKTVHAAPPPATAAPSLNRSLSSSTTATTATTTAGKPKALLAAERKREQDEREAARKAEQKREMERRRQAAQEEARQREARARQEAAQKQERERAQQAAADDAKRQAQKAAIEKRRAELGKKEQERRDPHRAINELGQSIQREASQAPAAAHQRPELGAGARRPSKLERPGALGHPPTNGVRPKRVFDPDQDDELAGPVRTGPTPGFQQNNGKRRRTSDEHGTEQPQQQPVRPTMAPPIRHSNMRKDATKVSIFGTTYPTAPPPAGMHAAQRPTVYANSTARPQPVEMSGFASGKIPFADAPNPAGPSAAANAYKTPIPTKQAAPAHATTGASTAMAAAAAAAAPSGGRKQASSPMFPSGENIYLSDIHTSDEDEDSEDERERKAGMPEWVRTPAMDALLRRQETVDADAVFGPVAPPNLEEWFTRDQKRLAKLRARTSSANWLGGDRLTEDEIRRDNAAREKMSQQGGWSYGMGAPT